MTTELLDVLKSLQSQIEFRVNHLDQLRKDQHSEEKYLRDDVETYQVKFTELAKAKLEELGMTWCTKCRTIASKQEAVLMLLEGTEIKEEKYGDCYGYREFSVLHCLCPECHEAAHNKHGQSGSYDSMAKKQERFLAFDAEKREDDVWAKRFGQWIKLAKYKCISPEIPQSLVDQIIRDHALCATILLEHAHGEETVRIIEPQINST